MADIVPGESDPISLKIIAAKLDAIYVQQSEFKTLFESKLNMLRDELIADIEKKVDGFKLSINKDIDEIRNECNALKHDVAQLKQSLGQTALSSTTMINNDARPANREPVNNVEQTLIISNFKEDTDDTLTLKDRISDLIKALGDQVADAVSVMQVKRLAGRNEKPGLVKVALDTTDSKIKVLKAKKKLQCISEYKNVWIRSSKSHAERIQEQNIKQLLQLIPGGQQLKLTSNGKVQPKNRSNFMPSTSQWQNPRGNGRSSRGTGRGTGRGLAAHPQWHPSQAVT